MELCDKRHAKEALFILLLRCGIPIMIRGHFTLPSIDALVINVAAPLCFSKSLSLARTDLFVHRGQAWLLRYGTCSTGAAISCQVGQ